MKFWEVFTLLAAFLVFSWTDSFVCNSCSCRKSIALEKLKPLCSTRKYNSIVEHLIGKGCYTTPTGLYDIWEVFDLQKWLKPFIVWKSLHKWCRLFSRSLCSSSVIRELIQAKNPAAVGALIVWTNTDLNKQLSCSSCLRINCWSNGRQCCSSVLGASAFTIFIK